MAATAIHYQPLTVIKLSGSLAHKFGRIHRRQLDSGKAWEAFNALKATVEGFAQEVLRLSRMGMQFAVFRNGKNVDESAFDRGGTQELRIVPVLSGSKRAGTFQVILGAVLVVAGVISHSPTLMINGGVMMLGGVVQMLSPQATGLKQSASPDNLPSYAFGSAKNTTASGNPVPICIGERRWGGAIVSASIYAEDKT